MPVELQDFDGKFSADEAGRLWRDVCEYTHHADHEVVVRMVDEAESRRLNQEYRRMNSPTNVLTFSYPREWIGAPRSPVKMQGEVGSVTHDIALCLTIVEREAAEAQVSLRDYTALVLVHAFLHAAGLDHERSEEDARVTHEAEQQILSRAGFSSSFS